MPEPAFHLLTMPAQHLTHPGQVMGRHDAVMQCDGCGETMRPETIIKLSRRFGRVRASHEPGAYCANYRTSVPLSTAQSVLRGLAERWAPLSGAPSGQPSRTAFAG